MAASPETKKLLNSSGNSIDSQSSNEIQLPNSSTANKYYPKNENSTSEKTTNESSSSSNSSKNTTISSQESQKNKCTKSKFNKKCMCILGTLLVVFIAFIVIIIATAMYMLINIPRQQQPTVFNQTNDEKVIKMSSLVNRAVIKPPNKPAFYLQPSNTSTSINKKITLNCKFDSDVNCYWLRDNEMIHNDDRYSFTSNKPTPDCSITIDGIQDQDFTSWKCGYTDENNNGLVSSSAIISQDLVIIEKPINVSASVDSSIILNCKFNKPVTCSWMRKKNVVIINGRYSYVSNEDGLKSDCSLRINGIQEIDFTSWSCGGHLDTDSDTTKETTIHISDNSFSTVIVKAPKGLKEKYGSKITLECVFSQPVTCAWLRNGNHVDIQGRYSFTNGNINKADCSITIDFLQSQDNGEWICSSMGDSHGDGTKSDEITVSVL